MPQPPVFCAGSLSLYLERSKTCDTRQTRQRAGEVGNNRGFIMQTHCGCVSVCESAGSALTAMLIKETPLVSATRDEGEQTQGCDTLSWLERKKGGAAARFFGLQFYFCKYEWTCNLQNTVFLVIRITSGFASGSWVAYLMNSGSSLTSGGAVQKWNMIISLRMHLMYSYNMTKCFVNSFFLPQFNNNQASSETGGLYLRIYCLSGDVSLPPFSFYLLLYKCISWRAD